MIKTFSFLISFSVSVALFGQSGEMALVPAGKFIPLYGSSTEVEVSSFFMDKYPVTDNEFKAFIKENEQWSGANIKRIFADAGYLKGWVDKEKPAYAPPWNRPVTNISWFAAKEYCKWKGKRLPTTYEWEFVALSSEKKVDASEDSEFYETLLQWSSMPNPSYYPEVKKGFKNYYGIYGIHGSIWEWVYDFNSNLLVGESRANNGIDRQLFCASGSLDASNKENYVTFLRYAFRSSLKANYTVNNLGFRCAKVLEQ